MNRFFPSRRHKNDANGASPPKKNCRPEGHDDSKLDSSSFHTKDVTDTSVRDSEASIHEIPPVLSQKEKTVARGIRTHLRRPDSDSKRPAVTHSPSQRRLSTGAEVPSSVHAPKSSAPPSSVPPPKPSEAASSSSASQQYHERARAASSAAGASQSYAQQSHHDERQRTRQAAEHAKMSYYSQPTQNNKDNSSCAESSRQAAEERKLALYDQAPLTTTSHQHRHSRPAPAPKECEPSQILSPMIEIFPGFSVPLRGSHETQMAVQRDFITPAMCFTCDEEMFCIQDAEYVLCPHCKAINPLTTTEADVLGGWSGGLGLGVSLAALYSLQQEIVTRQS